MLFVKCKFDVLFYINILKYRSKNTSVIQCTSFVLVVSIICKQIHFCICGVISTRECFNLACLLIRLIKKYIFYAKSMSKVRLDFFPKNFVRIYICLKNVSIKIGTLMKNFTDNQINVCINLK